MNIEDYVKGKDLDHLIVSEIKFGSRLEELQWGASGSGSWILNEYVTNGEFDTDTSDWTAVNSATLASVANGKIGNCLSITENGANNPGAHQIFAVEAETEYEVDLYIKEGTEDQYAVKVYDQTDGGVEIYSTGVLTVDEPDWTNHVNFKFTTPTGCISIKLLLQSESLNAEAKVIYFDRVSLQPVRRCPILGGEVVDVSADSEDFTEVFSIPDIDTLPSGSGGLFYYEDEYRKRLFLHMPDDDAPDTLQSGEFLHSVVASFWVGFCNRRKDTKRPISFERADQLLLNPNFELWNSAYDLKSWDENSPSGSTIERDGTVTLNDDSAYSVKISSGGDLTDISQQVSTKPRRKQKVGLWYMNDPVSGSDCTIRIYDAGENVYLDEDGDWQAGLYTITLPAVDEFTYWEIEFISHPSYSDYILLIGNDVNGTDLWVENSSWYRYRRSIHYLQFLFDSSIPSIYQAVGDYYQGDIRIEAGASKYLNDGWWYDRKGLWLFHNRKNHLKIGDIDSTWDELERIFTGVTRNPHWGDREFQTAIKDTRIADLTKVPRTRFNETDYPDVDEDFKNRVIPVLLGYKTNITPVWIDKEAVAPTYIFKVSETYFDSVNYAMEDIPDVYKDGTALTGGGVDYTLDLTNGEFALANDPGDALITCDAKGLKCDFEDGTYSINVADFTHFILTVLNKISEEKLSIATLLALKAARTQALGIYIKDEQETLGILRGLTQSCTYHTFPILDGTYLTKHYDPTLPASIDRWSTEDFDDFEEYEETDQCFKEVVIRYDQDPSTGVWKEVHSLEEDVENVYRIKNVLPVDTFLTSEIEAEALRDFFIELIRTPADKMTAVLPVKGLLYYPTIQAVFSRYYIDQKKDEEINIIENQVYRILEITKEAHRATARVVGTKGMQVSGLSGHSDVAHADHDDSVHTDTPHEDGHGDSHSDGAHSDSYTDVPYNDHTDEYHVDEPHEDHSDSNPHSDTAYTDSHGDVPYTDVHEDVPYDDHDDEIYTDFPHEDHDDDVPHTDTYTDVPYSDHTDSWHYDHTDEHQDDEPHEDDPYEDSHSDSSHSDSHSDTEHQDVAYVDSHTDVHSDVAHVDSYY